MLAEELFPWSPCLTPSPQPGIVVMRFSRLPKGREIITSPLKIFAGLSDLMTIVLFYFVFLKRKGCFCQNTAFLFSKYKPLNNLFVHMINLKLFLGWLLICSSFLSCSKKGK